MCKHLFKKKLDLKLDPILKLCHSVNPLCFFRNRKAIWDFGFIQDSVHERVDSSFKHSLHLF